MGIIAAVSIPRLAIFTFSIYLIVFLLLIILKISKTYFKKQFFITSFSEGNSLSTLAIKTTEKVRIIDESKYLKSINFTQNGDKEYLLASSDFDSLRKIACEIENNNLIINYQLNEC